MTVLLMLLSEAYTLWVLPYLLLGMQFKKSMYVNITIIIFLVLNSLCSLIN